MLRAADVSFLPTLRLYEWETTISLGYFQHYDDVSRQDSNVAALPVVRRLTGGGAILHDLELTYSMVLPVSHPIVDGRPNRLYEIAHDAMIELLSSEGLGAHRNGNTDDSGAAKGPFFCFARRHALDVLIGNDKIAGSAQRRTRTAILQHGSLILGRRFAVQPSAEIDHSHEALIARARIRFPEIFTALLNMQGMTGEWSAKELEEADALRAKYLGAEWTRRV